jgi:hypothetical protein
MLKSVTLCTLLVAALALGWQRYEEDDAPYDVQHGTSLTWGSDGRVWGWFPVLGTNKTSIGIFDPSAAEDSMWDDSTAGMMAVRVKGASCTFQWMEQPVFWGSGWHKDESNDTVSRLYCYYPDNDSSAYVTISAFRLGDGAAIAYDPNRAYWAVNYAVPGWIYCLTDDPGDGRSFWRYAIPGGWYVPPELPVYGFYPDSGAIISDLTPHLAWGNTGAGQYRVQVSASSSFASNVVDSVVTDPDFHATAELDNGTYFWRSASWSGGQWVWCSAVHSFDLQGGWQHLADILCGVEDGAAIAYDSGSFADGYRSILALPGGSTDEFYRYRIGTNTWTQLASATNEEEDVGTCLTTRTPTYEGAPLIMARFSTQDYEDVPSQYDADQEGWGDWCVDGDPIYNSHFPRPMGNSAMVLGGDLMYLFPGSFDGFDLDFYRVNAPASGGGGQAGISLIGGAKARAITGHDGIEVEYQLPAATRVRATVHDAVGRQVCSLDAGKQSAGTHRLRWDHGYEGRRLSSGAYFVLLDLGTGQARLKAVVQ